MRQVLLLSIVGLFASVSAIFAADKAADKSTSIYDFEMKDIDGKPVKLSDFKGKVLMVVNTASFCGNTPQYANLEKLYNTYKDKGFVILAFPANEFGKQEPGTDGEIKTFCTEKYHVTFPVFSKIVVKGDGQHPLYAYLTSKEANPKTAKPIEWNFAKFLISRDGKVVDRFPAKQKPDEKPVVAAIEAELAK
jgi:glutathione peroxidase